MKSIASITLFALGLVALVQAASAQSRGLVFPGRTASAQSKGPDQAAPAQSNCKDTKGTLVEFWGGGNDSPGTLSNAGWLNGTTYVVFTSPGFPTPVPNQFSFTGAYIVTTSQGQLKGTRTFLSDVVSGWAMDMTIIDPTASTGIFAGATGVLYTNQIESNTALPPTTYVSEIMGRICLAR